jgi:hypothetical protein
MHYHPKVMQSFKQQVKSASFKKPIFHNYALKRYSLMKKDTRGLSGSNEIACNNSHLYSANRKLYQHLKSFEAKYTSKEIYFCENGEDY